MGRIPQDPESKRVGSQYEVGFVLLCQAVEFPPFVLVLGANPEYLPKCR